LRRFFWRFYIITQLCLGYNPFFTIFSILSNYWPSRVKYIIEKISNLYYNPIVSGCALFRIMKITLESWRAPWKTSNQAVYRLWKNL